MIVTVDGGPDENPRYTEAIECAIDYFLSQDLDAFFLATNATDRSAFNRVKRRMVKFSKELSGVSRKEKRLTKSQKKNFGYAGEILAKIWSGMIINGHPVLAEFFSEEADQEVIKKSEE